MFIKQVELLGCLDEKLKKPKEKAKILRQQRAALNDHSSSSPFQPCFLRRWRNKISLSPSLYKHTSGKQEEENPMAGGADLFSASSFPVSLSLVLVLLISVSASGLSFRLDDGGGAPLSLRSRYPYGQAEKLIRQLNLLPGTQLLQRESKGDDGLKQSPPLVERRFKFPNIADPVSVEDLGHHAGYYRLPHAHDASMFYFFFESRGSKDDPVVIWLTGGPGCSSELALFYENGPFTIADNMSLLWNDYGWDKVSNLIYVDQPTGTGFSYTTDRRDIRHNEKGVSDDLYDFLQEFFKEHPEFAKNDFYITGESYAGHYIPAFASRVYEGNNAKEGIHINLKGFAIGNGLTDPAIQYRAYPDYALEMGIIQESDFKRINKYIPVCELAIQLCGSTGTIACFASYLVCNSIFSSILGIAGKINYYDVRKQCEGSLCYDFSNMEKFLNQKTVRDVLGVGDIEFVSCSPTVYQAMLTDWMKNLEVGIPKLIEDGIKLLVYAGEYDLICNWLGNSRWVESMEWSGRQSFVASPTIPFTVDGLEAGLLKAYKNLSFLKVHDAGHMVPMDQPKASLEMLKRWMEGKLNDGVKSEGLVSSF